jgi:hypothetical protein
MKIYIDGYFEVGNWLVMMKIALRVIYIFQNVRQQNRQNFNVL